MSNIELGDHVAVHGWTYTFQVTNIRDDMAKLQAVDGGEFTSHWSWWTQLDRLTKLPTAKEKGQAKWLRHAET